jgi:o-succinylbenzoate synthase
LKAYWRKHILDFRFIARTSRNEMRTKETWILYVENELGQVGLGECSMLRGLSPDDPASFEQKLEILCRQINSGEKVDSFLDYPAIRMGYEMAMLDLKNGGKQLYFPSDFTGNKRGILINGLIWMADYDSMLMQIQQKIEAGYQVIKLKIGALDFQQELRLIAGIRQQYSKDEIQICVDANGAFVPQEALSKLERLAAYDLHSIEQPIRAGQWKEMASLCKHSPLPVALDEELIGIYSNETRHALLETINPRYIILKPSLLGGFAASEEWIEIAGETNTGWWITSLLESNIGLNAIAQWAARLPLNSHQGLGTGQLYHNNFDSPLYVENGKLYYHNDVIRD